MLKQLPQRVNRHSVEHVSQRVNRHSVEHVSPTLSFTLCVQSSLYCGEERGEDRDPINMNNPGEERGEDRDPIIRNNSGEERGEDRVPIIRNNPTTCFVPVPSQELDFQRHMSGIFVFFIQI